MFQFPAYALAHASVRPSTLRVPPFRYLRINSCLQIPGAFRSLPRLSSLLEAKASSVRSCSLSRTFCEFTCDSYVSNLLVLPLKLQSHIATRKNSNSNITDFNLFYFFTSLSLSVLSMNFVFPSSLRKGIAKVVTFFEPANFFKLFFINLY